MKFLYNFLIVVMVLGCTTVELEDRDEDIAYIMEVPERIEEVSGSAKGNAIKNATQNIKISTLSELVNVSLSHNPQIKSARYKWQATVEKYPQVTSLPDPILTYTYFLKEPETRVGPQKQQVSLQQHIPFPKKLYLKGEIVKDEAKIARLGYERVVRDIVTQVQKSFYELCYIETALQITRNNTDLLQRLLAAANAEYSDKKTSLSDVMKAQSQLAQLQYDKVRLEELKQVEIGQLNALLNRPPDETIELQNLEFYFSSELPSFQQLYNHALQNSQEVLAADIAITKADRKLALAFTEYFPDFSIGATWIEVDRTLSGFNFDFDDDGQDIVGVTFGINIPLWIPKRNARVRESKYAIKSAKEGKQDIENQLSAKLKKIYYKVSNAKRLVVLYQNRLLPDAEKSMQLSENWYRDGKKSLLGVLESHSVWQNFSLALARAQSDYAQGIVMLSQLCGGSIPQINPELQEKQ